MQTTQGGIRLVLSNLKDVTYVCRMEVSIICVLFGDKYQHAVRATLTRKKCYALVHVLPTHVQQRYVEVARVRVQRILYFLSFPPRLQGQVRRVFPRVGVLSKASRAKIPEEHAAAIKRPYRVLW